jgi:hypothetical protein
MINKALFYATVSSVYPEIVYEVSGVNKIIKRDAYTVDIVPTSTSRGIFINVPVLRMNSGGIGSTGISMMPSEGDLVLCGYIEGYSEYPVCLGTINNKHKQSITSQGNKRNDFTLHHASGNYVQLRDNIIKIKHTSGAEVQISGDGNINIYSSSDININSDTVVNITGTEKVNIKGSEEVNITSSKINLGEEAQEQLIKGNMFKQLVWDAMVVPHFHNTIFGPTSPSTSLSAPFPEETVLSKITRTE